MNVKANGTHAKDIALHFVQLAEIRTTPQIMGKTIKQAKTLLENGYSKKEVIKVIDFIILTKKVNLYSLGYVNSSINDVLREIEQQELEEQTRIAKEEWKQLAEKQATSRSEVSTNDESSERNRAKARRINIQSRKRTQPYLDMFERQ